MSFSNKRDAGEDQGRTKECILGLPAGKSEHASSDSAGCIPLSNAELTSSVASGISHGVADEGLNGRKGFTVCVNLIGSLSVF